MPGIKLITENLADELIPGIQRASGIYILTSFVMESGVRLLEQHLQVAASRGAEIKILAGDYLFVTQPEALRRLLAIAPNIEARFWRSKGTSFHPKAYLLDYDQGQGLMIVGSSNMSLSAFRLGYEWNLAMNAKAGPVTFQDALDQFMRVFLHEQTVPLNSETINEYEKEYGHHHQQFPHLVRMITEQEESEMMLPQKPREGIEFEGEISEIGAITPRIAQQEALDALHDAIIEGYERAMVVMATGLGKTYLAAFLAIRYNRVLFIAHREEILHQSQRSFQHVMPERSSGLYNGMEKEEHADIIFASIFTLGMKKHRERFAPETFDLIVVDEFHHAAAKSYKSVLDYYRPQFLLGITATPDRMDGKDVYALCEGNVAYRNHFVEAISRGWLSPFQYYGIYDDTDYSKISWLGTRYDEEELLAAQLKKELSERIFDNWLKYKQTRTLAFCSSIRHADYLAGYFRGRGVRVVSLHSRTTEMTRPEAIRRLEAGELEVIFTVDLFNEGVDIPSVDTLLFVRPTESLAVFTQQVGRGLRLADGKTHCTIIDLIGNYRNADIKLGLLRVDEAEGEPKRKRKVAITPPPGCSIELEVGVVNLLEALAVKKGPKNRLLAAYNKLKQEFGRRPTYLELHLQGQEDSRGYAWEFGSYVGFLYWAGELTELEEQAYLANEQWLKEVERTRMEKSYKMVLLLAMLQRGVDHWRGAVTPVETATFFHGYYVKKEYRRRADWSDKGQAGMQEYDERKVAALIARMPMTMWSGSSRGLVTFEDGVFAMQLDVRPEHERILYEWTREVCEYRLQGYFEKRT